MLPSIDAIEQALERGVKLFYFESPVRLTGAAFAPSTVEQLAHLLASHDAYAIWDQGLSPFVSGSEYLSLGAPEGMAERVTLVSDVFPGLGLEGLALGSIATSERWAKPITSLKQIMSICTATASQYAALKVGESFDTELGELLASLQVLRQEAVERLTGAGVQVHTGQVASLIALTVSREIVSGLRYKGYRFADGADFGNPEVQRLTVMPGSDIVDALLSQLSGASS
jgi:aspartate/methionine/tyrosine aminotransferase